jgi:hypothetical protein
MFSLSLCAMSCGAGRGETSWTDSLQVLERPAGPNELAAYPEDGKSAGVNPPGFYWTPQDRAKAYRLEIRKTGATSRDTLRMPPVSSTACPLSNVLDSGDYSWQVAYLDSNGKPYGVSKTRRFHMAAGVPQLPMPDLARLKARLVGVRPRLFLTRDRASQIRQAVDAGNSAYWEVFIRTANAAIEEQSYPEPPPVPGGKPTAADWRRVFTPAKLGSAHLARTALAYKLMGDRRYLDAAKRWMLTLASWNPRGMTSHGLRQPDGTEGVDEASMPMLERMSLAWDWMGDQLSPEERAKVLASMRERGNQVLQLLEREDFLSHPYSNHGGRVLAFLGLAGLSFTGDIPEADQWLDYVLRCYLTVYPFWGGDEGGWAQGTSYWSAYLYWLTDFCQALRGVADIDLFRRPFYHNTGYFALYFQPAYAPRGAFGDGGDHGPGEVTKVLAGHLADADRKSVV